jgi:hypothetical protein
MFGRRLARVVQVSSQLGPRKNRCGLTEAVGAEEKFRPETQASVVSSWGGMGWNGLTVGTRVGAADWPEISTAQAVFALWPSCRFALGSWHE